jgi:hypothetical protein
VIGAFVYFYIGHLSNLITIPRFKDLFIRSKPCSAEAAADAYHR